MGPNPNTIILFLCSNFVGKLGWLNPLLYKLAASDVDNAFNDVTEGSNNYCDQANGFPAVKGWDPVTGVSEWVSG